MDFSELLGPIGVPKFLSESWEREPLCISRHHPGFYQWVFSAAEIDRLLVQSNPSYPQMRLVSKSSGIAWDALSDGWLKDDGKGNLASVAKAYAGGASLVVEMRRCWPEIDRLCRSAEILLHHKASAELYLTPPNSQAFDIHFDVHDVFLLQLRGTKEWKIYDPVFPLPTAETGPNALCGHLVGAPRLTIQLADGDLLYIPRGFPHQGLTSDEASLHITIGIYPYRLHDLVIRALAVAADQHKILRGSLPAGFLSGSGRETLQRQLKECLALLNDDNLVERALTRLGEEFLAGMSPVPDGQFEQLCRLPSMTTASVVERRENVFCLIRSDFDGVTLHYPGGSLTGPPWLRDAFEQIATAKDAFPVSDLPDGLDPESKLVLARRLVRDNVLRIQGSKP